MKTHFGDVEYGEWSVCNTLPEDVELTDDWSEVTCKRCLKKKQRYLELERVNEEHIIREMGDMADFFNKYNWDGVE